MILTLCGRYMTIQKVLMIAKHDLLKIGVETPFLDAELLLAHCLGRAREFVVARPEYELTAQQLVNFNEAVKRRLAFEPVAKIIGVKEFWGREFVVNAATLDPRPDSESVIETIIDLIPDKSSQFKVLDLGTGSGCLLLTILAEYPLAEGLGVDIAEETLEVAKNNAAKLGLAKRGRFILNDWANDLGERFDLIISNPPYIKNSDIEELAPEVVIYEPHLALFGGSDGLDCYRKIACQTSEMPNNFHMVLEFGKGQENAVREIFEQAGMQFVSFRNDLSGAARCILVANVE